jgi:hypothetical protein
VIIFGFRSRQATIAMLNLACRNGHVAVHRLLKVSRWFTLFFIPLVPVSQKYCTVCAQCGTVVKWTKADAEAAAAHTATTPAPAIADPVAPPLVSGPPAGWYADPNGTQRYWDGNAWSDTAQQS